MAKTPQEIADSVNDLVKLANKAPTPKIMKDISKALAKHSSEELATYLKNQKPDDRYRIHKDLEHLSRQQDAAKPNQKPQFEMLNAALETCAKTFETGIEENIFKSYMELPEPRFQNNLTALKYTLNQLPTEVLKKELTKFLVENVNTAKDYNEFLKRFDNLLWNEPAGASPLGNLSALQVKAVARATNEGMPLLDAMKAEGVIGQAVTAQKVAKLYILTNPRPAKQQTSEITLDEFKAAFTKTYESDPWPKFSDMKGRLQKIKMDEVRDYVSIHKGSRSSRVMQELELERELKSVPSAWKALYRKIEAQRQAYLGIDGRSDVEESKLKALTFLQKDIKDGNYQGFDKFKTDHTNPSQHAIRIPQSKLTPDEIKEIKQARFGSKTGTLFDAADKIAEAQKPSIQPK